MDEIGMITDMWVVGGNECNVYDVCHVVWSDLGFLHVLCIPVLNLYFTVIFGTKPNRF